MRGNQDEVAGDDVGSINRQSSMSERSNSKRKNEKEKSKGDDDEAKTPKRKFFPYKNASLSAVMFHMVIKEITMRSEASRNFLGKAHAFRWRISRPLEIRLFSPSLELPAPLQSLEKLKVKHILLELPLIILFIVGLGRGFGSTHDLIKTGNVARLCLEFVFLAAMKSNNLFSFFLGISFKRLLPFHATAATMAVLMGLLHTRVAYRFGLFEGQVNLDIATTSEHAAYGIGEASFFKFAFENNTNKSGFFLLLFVLIMWLTSGVPHKFRRRFYDIWWCLHIVTAFMICVYGIMHSVTGILFFAIWWVVDLLVRFAILSSNLYPDVVTLRPTRVEGLTQLSFRKTSQFSYLGGQFVKICIPEVGSFMFHPLSITSAPNAREIRLYCLAVGGWTNAVADLAEEKPPEESSYPCFIEGPYGSLSVDLQNEERYQMVLLVSGGIGATHCHGVGKGVLKDHLNGRRLYKLQTVWAVRDANMVRVLKPPMLEDEGDDFEIEDNIEPVDFVEETKSSRERGPIDGEFAIIQTDIYVTQGEGMNRDRLGMSFHTGRPDLDAIIQDAKVEASRKYFNAVAVIGCGPISFMRDLRLACEKHSDQAKLDTCRKTSKTQGIIFDLHEETYQL